MVYDESKNLVGDLHYRQAEEFGEGLELKLDRPVLVQVEEPLGQTNTDLTPLLSRQRQDATSDSQRPSQLNRATFPRINPGTSQVKPKSIKELLGASQARVGRTRFPLQSPYDQRQALAESQPVTEPPAKRQKREADKENHPIPKTNDQVASSAPSQIASKQLSIHDESTRVVVDLSSDDDPVDHSLQKKHQPVPNQQKSSRSKPSLNSRQNENKRRKSAKARGDNFSTQDISNRQREGLPGIHRGSGSPRPTSPSSATSRIFTDTSRILPSSLALGPRKSLKFAPDKPRPRLMYKALLSTTKDQSEKPSQRSQLEPFTNNLASTGTLEATKLYESALDEIHQDSSPSPSINNYNVDAVMSNARDPSQSPALPDDGHVIRYSPSGDNAASDRTYARLGSEKCDDNAGEIPASPLFMPRTVSQESLFPTQDFPADNTNLGILSQCNGFFYKSGDVTDQATSETSMTQLENQPQQDTCDLLSSPEFIAARFRAHSTKARDKRSQEAPEPMNITPAKPSSITVPAVESSLLRSKARQSPREFRRVLSENYDGHAPSRNMQINQGPDDHENTSSFADIPHPVPHNSAHQRNPIPDLPPILRKSESDPSTLFHPVAPPCLPPSSSPDEVQPRQQSPLIQVNNAELEYESNAPLHNGSTTAESGPWTSNEAYLLFEWWPSGKAKPNYGQNVSSDMIQDGISTTRYRNGLDQQEAAVNTSTNAMSRMKYGTFGSARLVSQR